MKAELKLSEEVKKVEMEVESEDVTFKDILKTTKGGKTNDKLVLAWRYNQQKDATASGMLSGAVTGEFKRPNFSY